MFIPNRIKEELLQELKKVSSDKDVDMSKLYFDVEKLSNNKYEVIATHKTKRESVSTTVYGYQIGLDSLSFTIDSDVSKRSKDENGYLHIKDNPIAKCGVFPYLKREVRHFEDSDPEGDEIVQVYRSFEDLANNKDMFANKPIILDHEWVGEDGTRNTISGVIGPEITAKEPYLIADLTIYDKDLIQKIENNEIVELSPGYQCDIIEQEDSYLDQNYQYCQMLKSVNHLAVVERGRSGRDLKILDSENPKKTKGAMLMKILDFLMGRSQKIQDKEIDLNSSDLIKIEDSETRENPNLEKFYSQEKNCILRVTDSKVEIEDEEEEDEDPRTEDEDVEDEEVEDEDSEKTEDEEVEDEDEDDDSKKTQDSFTIQRLVKKEVSKIEKRYSRLSDAYNRVKNVLDTDFDASGMTASEIYAHGYQCLTGKKISDSLDSKTAFLVAAESKKNEKTLKFTDSKKPDDKRIENLMSILR